MEVGRRSLSSKNEFRGRGSGRKKMGALPLAMVLSFNDKDIHPDCPNVSNPYHKCGRHCLDEIPAGKNFLDALRSDGDREWEKKSEKKGVNPNCPHASNPYHKCAKYCLENRQDAGKDQAGMHSKKEKKEVFTTERGVKVLNTAKKTDFHPLCKHASNPNHECAESCFQSVTDGNIAEGENPKGVSNKTNKSKVNLNCYASGHNKVAEYCVEDTPKKEHLKGVIGLKSLKEGEKVMSKKDGNATKPKEETEIIETVEQIVNLEYKNASNPPSHVCPEYCSESVQERDRHEQAVWLKSTKEGCKNALKPHHECTEFCFKSTPDRNLAEEENFEGAFMENDENVHSSPKHAPSPCNKVTQYYFEDISEKGLPEIAIKPKEESTSNPDHAHTEHCFQSVPEKERRRQKKPKGVSFKIDKCGEVSNHKHVSNPYLEAIEYCFDNDPELKHPNESMKPREERMVVTAEQGVDHVCKYKSNPYHECTEYCFQNLPMKDRHGKALMQSKENKTAVVLLEKVNPQCEHASNPYHVCAEYCFQNVPNGHHPGRRIKNLEQEDIVVLPSERRVSPECKFASNPYHVCVEYCFQNALEREHNEQVMKLKSLKELKNLVGNKKLTSGRPQCEFASNPYHQCTEYCSNKDIPGSKLLNGDERKKEKKYAPRRDDNPKYKNASNSFHKSAKYFPEAISPKNEAVEGSTATVEKKKRNSSKENKSREPTDVSPLHVDPSDLFHEWAKYCSQTKVAEDEIFKQEKKAGIGESTRRNGKGDGFLNDYDSANMEKVDTTRGFPRSLPISLTLFSRVSFSSAPPDSSDLPLSYYVFREERGT